MKKKKIYFNGSYLTLKQQHQMLGEDFKIYNTFHIWEKKPKKSFFYWGMYLVKNFWINFVSKERKDSDIQVFNSIIWCFFYNPQKKNILIIHSYDIGIGSEYVIKNSNSLVKRVLIQTLDLVLWRYIKKRILLFDTVFAATYDRYLFIQEHIRKDVSFLPNIVELNKKYTKKDYSKIQQVFCPERVDAGKWLDMRKQILSMIKTQLPHATISLLERGNNLESLKKWLQKNNIEVSWISYMEEQELHKKIYESDLVIGIFQNGALSITNIETMLLKTPIVTYDAWGVLKIGPPDIKEYTLKILQDIDFRKQEIEKNYSYVVKSYSFSSYSNNFTQAL